MIRGRAVILNPGRADNVKRREFLLASLASQGVACSETLDGDRLVLTWEGEPKKQRARVTRKRHEVPPAYTVERAMRARYDSEPEQVEYWDEIIRLAAERQGVELRKVGETWAVAISAHLAVTRGKDRWTIIHVVTGMVAAWLDSLTEAIRLAHEVAPWPEWAGIQSKADVTPEFKRKALQVLRGVAA